ncbi:hypothetical protein ES703_103952 [subsurface metagenome]
MTRLRHMATFFSRQLSQTHDLQVMGMAIAVALSGDTPTIAPFPHCWKDLSPRATSWRSMVFVSGKTAVVTAGSFLFHRVGGRAKREVICGHVITSTRGKACWRRVRVGGGGAAIRPGAIIPDRLGAGEADL